LQAPIGASSQPAGPLRTPLNRRPAIRLPVNPELPLDQSLLSITALTTANGWHWGQIRTGGYQPNSALVDGKTSGEGTQCRCLPATACLAANAQPTALWHSPSPPLHSCLPPLAAHPPRPSHRRRCPAHTYTEPPPPPPTPSLLTCVASPPFYHHLCCDATGLTECSKSNKPSVE